MAMYLVARWRVMNCLHDTTLHRFNQKYSTRTTADVNKNIAARSAHTRCNRAVSRATTCTYITRPTSS